MTHDNDASIQHVLSTHRVFGRLPSGALALLASQAVRVQVAAGTVAYPPGGWGEQLLLVERGALELADPDLAWAVPLAAGDWFGAGVTARRHQGNCEVRGACDSALIALPQSALAEACREQPGLALFFPTLPALTAGPVAGSAAAEPQPGTGMSLLATPVGSLVQRSAATTPPTASIAEVAQQMRSERVSSVLLVEGGTISGIVTDRDLRNRVLAAGIDPARRVADIATRAPLMVQAGAPAAEALALMARHNIHHVPVMDGERIAGVVTATNLSEHHGTSPVHLVGEIRRQTDVPGLARVTARVGALQKHLAASGASADGAGRIVTSITDALTVRLIQLAHGQMGPAPVDYVWVAAGSQGRSEQTARTDQDNCMVLDDAYDEASHGGYFRDFSRFVCDGLDACGYEYCPGEMMAMTDKWRQPRHRWLQYFSGWIDQPEPMALMLTSVFFDLRAIHGSTALLDGLRAQVLRRTRRHSLFLAHMAANARKHRPPLGLLGNIAPARSGEHAGMVDLKHSGIVPIVDLARVYALAGGFNAVNTRERLRQAAGGGEVTAEAARDLGEALEVLGRVRMAHQARRMARGLQPDNYLALEELSSLERNHLKAAFGVVQHLQAVLGQRYGDRY